jgi:hypothetical protein
MFTFWTITPSEYTTWKFEGYSSSSSGLTLFINRETGIIFCIDGGEAYFQGILYSGRPYTEKELEKIKDWVSACGIQFSYYRYTVCKETLRNAKIQPAFEEERPDDSEDEMCG